MSRSVVWHLCLAFGSLLFLNFATQCLAFPKREQEWSEKIGRDDLENSSVTPKQTPHLLSSEDAITASPQPSAASLNKILSSDQETQPTGAGLLQSSSAGLYTAAEPEVPAGEDTFGSSRPERLSAESELSKAVLTTALPAAASPNPSEEEKPWSSSHSQPLVEGTTDTTQSFLTYADSQLFTTESQEGVSLGRTPASYTDAKAMRTTSPRTEELNAATDQTTASFPGAESAADSVPGSILHDGEKPSQVTAENTQATSTEHLLVATAAYTLSVELETNSFLLAPEITVSVSSAVPATSVLSEEWDDTKLESGSQIRTPKGDSAEVTEVPEGEALMGPALLTWQGDEGSPAPAHLSSPAPASLSGEPEFSDASLFRGTGAVTDSAEEESAEFLAEATASVSKNQSEAHGPLGHAWKAGVPNRAREQKVSSHYRAGMSRVRELQWLAVTRVPPALRGLLLVGDTITQEMTTAAPEPEASPPFETQEQAAALEVPRDHGDPEEAEEYPSPVSDAPGAAQLSRGWGPLEATTASTTAAPLSPEVTPAAEGFMDTVTWPNEEFTPAWGFPGTPAGMMVEVTGSSLAPPASEASSEGTVPARSSANTAISYGLEQLESEEGEDDEDEEDEEDEDEEEEEEEEEEEDKDTDSLDESFDGDTELPGFTLPGVTSQEPGLGRGIGDPLGGATYQVPDAIEWEQRNQGLVRSWMEKLKDKAGYMSGMLVPVGVGIAGALFILGALYSIKVMNRRRRNGFKRHKRKQREFNSMQDRVMLLADSSEDEF
ncbi:armadillo-like helical domain-containing protein 4 [Erethizon dorsatum]